MSMVVSIKWGDEPKDIVQSLTTEQIHKIAKQAGVDESFVVHVIDYINKNDFISLGMVDMTPDVVMGFVLCLQQVSGLI